MNANEIVTVWLDETSDEHGWVVDTDVTEGGQSRTLKVFPATDAGYRSAVACAEREAAKRGLAVEIRS